MPSKIQLDENLWFLYICLQKSDLKSIDFTAVGASTNLKPPAARMRYTRLRRQIESGTLIGTHGTPFPSEKVVEKIKEASKKRKRNKSEEEDVHSKANVGRVKREKRDKRAVIMKRNGKEGEEKVKREDLSDEWESSDNGHDDSEFEGDSEDEMPLAKLKKVKMVSSPSSQHHTPSPTTHVEAVGRLDYGTPSRHLYDQDGLRVTSLASPFSPTGGMIRMYAGDGGGPGIKCGIKWDRDILAVRCRTMPI